MFVKWNHEFIPSFLSQVDSGDSSGSGASPGGGGESSSASASPSSAPSSGSTPSSTSPSTPSAVPSSATPTPEGTAASDASGDLPSGDGAMDFEAIFGGSGEPAPLETPLAPAPVAVAAKPPAAQAAPAQAAPAKAPEPAPAVTPSPTTATSTESKAPALDPSDPASIAAHLKLNKDAAITHIAEQIFKLSPEDVEALESDTVGTIPKLLARSFVEVQSVMLNQMARLVPQMIQRQTEALKKNAEAEEAFYGMWPTIDRSVHGDLVKKYAVTYRQMHPEATREQMFADIGPIVMMAAKIPPTAPVVAANGGKPPAAPSPKPKPFVPAGGSAPGGTHNTVELNPVEAMFADQG